MEEVVAILPWCASLEMSVQHDLHKKMQLIDIFQQCDVYTYKCQIHLTTRCHLCSIVDVIVHTPHANMKPLASDQTLLSVIVQYEL